MEDTVALLFTTLGALLLLGLATDFLGRRTALPRVTLLLIFGVLIGPSGFNLLPQGYQQLYPFISDLALLMVGFLLGEKLGMKYLRRHGKEILLISAAVTLLTTITVFLGLYLLSVPLELALLLAAISTATAPAATADVVNELKAKGPFSQTLLGIVAIDDAWGLIIFSLILGIIVSLSGDGSATSVWWHALYDLGGSILLGLCIGLPMSLLTGRLPHGQPTVIEALGLVFICGGLALWLDVSFLLAAMVMGATVSNLARHHQRPFHAINKIESPFLIIFFILAGASLEIDSLIAVGWIGIAYILLRIGGRLVGVYVGSRLTQSSTLIRQHMAKALMPQAGIALGMALVAAERLPQSGPSLMSIVIGTTVFFELFGPVLTRRALIKSGEAGMNNKELANNEDK